MVKVLKFAVGDPPFIGCQRVASPWIRLAIQKQYPFMLSVSRLEQLLPEMGIRFGRFTSVIMIIFYTSKSVSGQIFQ